jgi:acetyl-CoA acetyltransferase
VLRRATAIAGVGVAEITRDESRDTYALGAAAAKAAFEDAGISKTEIDGILTYNSLVTPHPMHSTVLAEYLGLRPTFNATLAVGGATPTVMIAHAAAAIYAGLARIILVIHADNRASGSQRADMIARMAQDFGDPNYEYPYGPTIPGLYALVAQRYMHDFGLSAAQLASVAVTMRRHAALNPRATRRAPISVDDVLASRPICLPLRKLDCCLITDFGGAAIVTSADRAEELRPDPVYILGIGQATTHEQVSQAEGRITGGLDAAGRRALEMAGVGPGDIQVAGLYDSFTITVLAQLEEFGLCPPGQGGAWAEKGELGVGGRLPTNTHGGMLSASTSGLFHVIEVVEQLRGRCGDRQVPGAHVGLVNNSGGVFSVHCTLILGR